VRTILDRTEVKGWWSGPLDSDAVRFAAVVQADSLERVLDPLRNALGETEGFRVVATAVEASVPRLDEQQEQPAPSGKESSSSKPPSSRWSRVARDELYQELQTGARTTPVFLAMVVLSTIVAAIGLARSNATIVIGAMVIAPLLGPNMALALAATLGDQKLGWKALRTNAIGIALASGVAAVLGVVFPLDVALPEVASRIHIDLTDVLLGLCAGAAGALALTTGVATSLVGVMVAVALLPPLVVMIMLLVAGRFDAAANAGLLLGANVACVNLAGVGCFLVLGIRPGSWQEDRRARRVALASFAFWVLVLAALAVAIVSGALAEDDASLTPETVRRPAGSPDP